MNDIAFVTLTLGLILCTMVIRRWQYKIGIHAFIMREAIENINGFLIPWIIGTLVIYLF